MKSSVRVSIMVIVIILGMTVTIGGSYFLALYAIGQSQRNWCTALALLTHDPVPKPAPGNPARLENYNFYLDLITLQKHFGCLPDRVYYDKGGRCHMLIDYSTSRPSMSELLAAKVTGAGRYIGWDSVPGFPTIHKNLTITEAHELIGAGIEIFLAFEYQPDAAANGTLQGTKDGQLAKTQLAELEAPPDMCSYFAVDYDLPDYAPSLPDTPTNALAKLGPVGKYFQAINALKFAYEVGGYGGYYAIKRLFDAGLITKGWQTIAWSGGLLDPRAVIYQVTATSPIVGGDIDIRQHTATVTDYGQWPRPSVSPTTATPQEGIVVSLTTGGAANVGSKDGGYTWVFGTAPVAPKPPLDQHGWVVSFTTKSKAHVSTTDGGYTWKYSA